MTDQTIPAGKLRDLRDQYARFIEDAGTKEARAYYGYVVKDLEALLPTPPRPTLADMSMKERAACQWMQADVEGEESRVVIITHDFSGGCAALLDRWGNVTYEGHAKITPHPDLPPLEWPGDQEPAPALPEGWRLADHKDHGRVIVTNDTPNTAGDVCFVLPATDPLGYDWLFCDPSELTYLDTDQETDTTSAVPPNTLTVGSEWGDIDALTTACRESGSDQITVIDTDGDVSVWNGIAGWWQTGTPSDGYEPYTIIHTGREATQ